MPEHPAIVIHVSRARAGRRLDSLVHGEIPWRTRPDIKRLIQSGAIRLNGGAAKPGARVAAGDRIDTPVRDPRALSRQTLALSLPVLVEDPDFIVIAKPPCLSTHATGRYLKQNVVSALRWRYGDPPPMPVHRLDRETSGALLCARNREAHRALALQFERREVEKRYVALVSGEPREDEGVFEGRIGRGGLSRVHIRVTTDAADGAPAWTAFRVARRWPGFALLELWPRTGRQHQIRAQLAAAGHPVVGDKIYGPDEGHFLAHLEGRLSADARGQLILGRHALHAASLAFRHRRTRETIRAEAPLPPDMESFLEGLGPAAGGAKRKMGGSPYLKGEGGVSPRL